MPVRPDTRERQRNAAQFIFTDRTAEANAMRLSAVAVAERLRGKAEIDTDGLRNVLVYHGIGGVGKSRLSERLESWCRHELADADDWESPPLADPIQTGRWDFNGLQGQVDVPSLLIAIRAAVTSKQLKWPAFDLALAAYLAATRPGQRLATTTASDQTGDLLQVLGGIAGDLGATGLVTEFSSAAIGRLVSLVMKNLNQSRQLKRFGSLRDILDSCGRIPTGDNAPEVAAEILWLLTEEVEAREPAKRPVVAVFVDHFEKLQASDAIKAEHVVNLLMGYLPWVLFVVTGRNSLDWHKERDGLRIAGPAQWPLLMPGVDEEPRQHLLGHLSPEDTRSLLTQRRALTGWALSDELLEKIVETSGGWPLHVDAVCQIATNRTFASDTELTEDELLGDLPDLVKRLFEDLSPEEAHVFNAACLLPYFDVPLVAAVAKTTGGAVERCINRTIVSPNVNSQYPYRVHEEIRRLVRRAGSSVKGGWSTDDWRIAAEAALKEAGARHGAAQEAAVVAERQGQPRNDKAVTEAIVLGLTVAHQEHVYDDWLATAVRTAPTIRGLASFLPPVEDGWPRDEISSLIRLIHALARPSREAIPVLERLCEEAPRETPVRSSAGLWLAYRLRSEGSYEQAIDQLKQVGDDCLDRRPLIQMQIAITLRFQRLYRQALKHFERTLGATAVGYENFRAVCWQNHGVYGHPQWIFEERIDRQTSARFRLELRTTHLRRKVLEDDYCRSEARTLLEKSIEVAMPALQMNCLWALGTSQLAQPDELAETIHRMRQLIPQYHQGYRLGELLALRAFLSREESDIAAVAEAVPCRPIRGASFTLTEILMQELGAPLPPTGQPEEWLIPYDEVRANWLKLATGVIDRAKALA